MRDAGRWRGLLSIPLPAAVDSWPLQLASRMSISPTDAMRQAAHTAHFYMTEAVNSIDYRFGPGFAKANPMLVAAFMHVAGADYNNWNSVESIHKAQQSFDDAVTAVCLKIDDAIELGNRVINTSAGY